MNDIIRELNDRLSDKLKRTKIDCPECEDMMFDDHDYHCTFCEDWSNAYHIVVIKLKEAIRFGMKGNDINEQSIEKWINDNI